MSGLLNAAYFLPILHAAWFKNPSGPWPTSREQGRFETSLMLLAPPVVTALLTIAAGLLAGADFSPLGWAKLIAEREYRP